MIKCVAHTSGGDNGLTITEFNTQKSVQLKLQHTHTQTHTIILNNEK